MLGLLSTNASAIADGPADNIPEKVRQVPPVGIEVDPADRQELLVTLLQLKANIKMLSAKQDRRVQRLLPDVMVFERAIQQGLEFRELFSKRDVANAKKVLAEGLARSQQLLKGDAPWTTQKGLVVRGYVSKIDKTVQPYGLVIPQSYTFEGQSEYRMDLWFHGRGERSSESVFINQRMNNAGTYQPKNTIVLHPYGRYSNAFKFAGEIDVLEAMEHAKQHYRIDDDRIAVRGFSMGGAGCWQFAVHYSDMFFAANPGAGFSETPEFLKFFQKETLNPTWYEKKLWHMHDCPDWCRNLMQLPTVAYSGELDIQKQAADIMELALVKENLSLTHIIGPKTKHSIHPDSRKEIERRLDSLAKFGRKRFPNTVDFTTYTLKYNRMNWITVTGLKEHWSKGYVQAFLRADKHLIEVYTDGVTGVEINFPSGSSPFQEISSVVVKIDDQNFEEFDGHKTDRSVHIAFHKQNDEWKHGPAKPDGLSKQHDLQGPVDDAFLDSFVVVSPSGKAAHPIVDQWTRSELHHFVKQWRQQFRGDAIVKADKKLTDADIKNSNLILFGDSESNSVIKRVLSKLPIGWNNDTVTVGDKQFDSSHHAPILIYPNPLNPKRYVVINSGFTYREFAYLNNARQVSKIPDWAIVDLRTKPNSLWPGKIVAADFFDESWQLKTSDKPLPR
jgi:hypothetical protein